MDQNPPKESRPPINLRIKFRSESVEQFIERYAVDVSRGGIFIRTREPLAVGTHLKLDFQFQNGTPLMAGDGTVVWIREVDANRTTVPPGMGVRFDKLTPESQAVLEQLLIEKAKRERSGVPGSGSQGAGGIAVRRPSAMFATLDSRAAAAALGSTSTAVTVPATPAPGAAAEPPSGPLAAVTAQLAAGNSGPVATAAPTPVGASGSGRSGGVSAAASASEATTKYETPAYRPLGTARNPFSSVGAPASAANKADDARPSTSDGDDDSAAPFGDINDEPTQIAGRLPSFLLSDDDATVANAQSALTAATEKAAADANKDVQAKTRRPLPGMGHADAGGGRKSSPATAPNTDEIAASAKMAGNSTTTAAAVSPVTGETATKTDNKTDDTTDNKKTATKADVVKTARLADNRRRSPAVVVGLTVLVLGAAGIFLFRFFSSQSTQTGPSAASTTGTPVMGPAPTGTSAAANEPAAAPIGETAPTTNPSTPPAGPAGEAKPAAETQPAEAPAAAVTAVGDDTGSRPGTDAPSTSRKTSRPKSARAREKAAEAAVAPAGSGESKVGEGATAAPAAATTAAPAAGVAPSTPPTKADEQAPPSAAAAETEPPVRQLRITSKPDGADVVLDGQIVGKTPQNFDLGDLTAPHFLAVRKDGFESFEQTISASSPWSKPKTVKGKSGSVQLLKINAKLKASAGTAEIKPAGEPLPTGAEPAAKAPPPAKAERPAVPTEERPAADNPQ